MRSTWVAAGLLVLLVGTGVVVWWASPPASSPAPAAKGADPVAPRGRRERVGLDPNLPLSVARGPKCDPEDAPRMIARARGEQPRRRHDPLLVVPRAMLDRSADGMIFQVALEDDEPAGLQLAAMEPGSVAFELGFQQLDVLTEVDGRPVRRIPELAAEVDRFRERGVACARVWREGRWIVRWLVLEPGS